MPQKQHQLRDVQSKRGPQIKAEQKWLEIDKEKKKKTADEKTLYGVCKRRKGVNQMPSKVRHKTN